MNNIEQDRQKYIGGSDLAAWFALHPFLTREAFLSEKIYGIKPYKDEAIMQPYIDYGNDAEPIIRQLLNEKYDTEFTPQTHFQEFNGVEFRGNTDGEDDNILIEIKTNKDGKIQPHYLIQAQLYASLVNFPPEKIVIAISKRPKDFEENKANYKVDEKAVRKATKIYEYTMDELRKEVDTLIGKEFYEGLTQMAHAIVRGRNDADKRPVLAYVGTDDQFNTFTRYKQLTASIAELQLELADLTEQIEMGRAEPYFEVIPAQVKKTNRFSAAEFKKANPDLYKQYVVESETNYKAKIKEIK